jgi:hypothetical protein
MRAERVGVEPGRARPPASLSFFVDMAGSDRRATVDCFGREEREAVKQKRKQMKVPKAKQSTLKPVGFIAELRAALKPARKKSKRNKSNPYQVNSGRLSCRDFGLI